ncbi:MAG: hypothetical protein WCL06_14805, partial [Bacteroidota bacterium]
KKYLQIDKLSTFLASDIQTNQKVKNIFVEAGCGSLFELDQGLLNKHIVDQVKPKADLILEYLGLNKSSETDKMYEEESKISE